MAAQQSGSQQSQCIRSQRKQSKNSKKADKIGIEKPACKKSNECIDTVCNKSISCGIKLPSSSEAIHLTCEKQGVCSKNRCQSAKDTQSIIQDIQRQLTCDRPLHIQGNSSCSVNQVGCSSIGLKQQPPCNAKCKDSCDVKQKERNIPPVKKETSSKVTNTTVAVNKNSETVVTVVKDNTPNNSSEELSKAKKRRLRKRKLLLQLAAQNNQQNETTVAKESEKVTPPTNLTVTTCRPIAVGTNTEIAKKNQEQQPTEVVRKEIRKRIDKTTLEARKKKIKAKSPVESHHNSRKEDICCIPINSTCQKLQNEIQTSLSGFSFPEANRSCLEKPDSFRKKADSVFYFGETKSELQEISNLNLNTKLPSSSENRKTDLQNIFKIKDITFSNIRGNTAFTNKCENNIFYKTENRGDISSCMLKDVNKSVEVNNIHILSPPHSGSSGTVPICSPAFNTAAPVNLSQHNLPYFHNIEKVGINTVSSVEKLQNCEILKQLTPKVANAAAININMKQNLHKPNVVKESAVSTDTVKEPTKTQEPTSKTARSDVTGADSKINQSIQPQNVLEAVATPPLVTQPTAPLPSPLTTASATTVEKKPINESGVVKINNVVSTTLENSGSQKMNKSREDILAEREARKAAKLAAKNKNKLSNTKEAVDKVVDIKPSKEKDVTSCTGSSTNFKETNNVSAATQLLKAQDSVKEVNFDEKMQTNVTPPAPIDITTTGNDSSSGGGVSVLEIERSELVKSKAELRAERRAKQEAQRAAKAEKQQQPKPMTEEMNKTGKTIKVEKPKAKEEKKAAAVEKVSKSSVQSRIKLFSHLHQEKQSSKIVHQLLHNVDMHPAIVRLGAQYAARVVAGSNARCIALLQALKEVINDYSTPAEKEFSRGLEEYLAPATAYLQHCRPLSVSMTNALRHIKWHLTQLPNNVPDVEARKKLCDIVDTYVRDQIDVAGQAICNAVQQKIANGDVILTYGCSSLVYRILVESHNSKRRFRVIVVDSGPWREGREMLRRLVTKGIQCTYVLISAASFVMREVSKVLLGAHALLANGYVMSRAGCSQIALLAHSNNVPVLVCCETHKFSERVQTDAFVCNELGDPDEFVRNGKEDISEWRSYSTLTPLTLAYDVTPPDLVTAVVTELAILPCTSVPVILRIKPSECLM